SGNGNDTTTPYVSIVSPTDGEDVSGSVAVVVAAGDDAGIANVALTIDGASIGTDDTAPYQFTWTAPTAPGSHTLVATATDVNGQTGMAMATVTVAGGGSGSGSGNGATGGGGNQLPSCSLNAGGASGGLFPLGLALFVVTRRRRR
ncbi:MAG TPA: Ig-like domain-containing protein, partial [Kofleriaceae bacterium]|nr:Ig-like domain-containing protein [Kofleriaceae bacterium]